MVYASELTKGKGKSTQALAEAREHPRGNRGANLIDTFDPATLTGVQLLIDRTTARDGHGVDLLRAALEQLEAGVESGDRPEWKNISAIDLNFGCPAPDISRRGAGPAQLRRRSKIRALFEVLAEWRTKTSLNIGAVGAKIRLGNNEREKGYQVHLPVAEAAAESGLDYLVVHARHGEQRSRDAPDWKEIQNVKQATLESSMKIIGNGDVRTPDDVRRMKQMTGCDGIMVGRAAMRNPWILQHLASAFDNDDVERGAVNKAEQQEIWNEWPSLVELEKAEKENIQWSENQKATERYSRFRQENFQRLLQEVVSSAAASSSSSSSSSSATTTTTPASTGGDWYQEWSAAATRRRHLDKAGEDGNVEHGARRSSNSRDWKKKSRAQKQWRKNKKKNVGQFKKGQCKR